MPKLASDARVRAARLDSQGLSRGLSSIAAAVERLGAVQAQDLTAAKWVLGARVAGSTVADVDAAIESREVVRSWPLRGTLHVLPSAMLRPILAITGPRELQRAATRHAGLELDAAVYRKARSIAERELAGGSRSRAELQEAWEAAGIATGGQRGYHLIWWLASEAIVCWGPIEARGQRLVLLDEWAPGPAGSTVRSDREATLAALFLAYVRGHGPVTVRDFAWWSGLTLTDARLAHVAVGDAVTAFDAERYVAADAGWPADHAAAAPRATGKLALAAFDEYFLGYTDRGAVCDPAFAGRVIPGGNGVFQPILVSGGRVVGTWKRKPGGRAGSAASVIIDPFTPVKTRDFEPAFANWARFWGNSLGAVDQA